LDNLTHSLFGWTLARAGVGRNLPYATATLVLASNAPDIDVVTAARGGISYLAAHRGPTHGPLGLVGLSAVAAAACWAWARWRGPRPGALPIAARQFVGLWIVAAVGVLCHVLMDLATSYGTRILSPFVWTWYAFDWMPIIDVYLWLILIGALAAGRRPGLRTRAAWIALVLMACDYGARAVLHEAALARAASQTAAGTLASCAAAPTLVRHPALVEARLAGPAACIEAAALPTFFSPFAWRAIRQYPQGYETSDRSALGTAPWRGAWLAAATGPDVARARATRAGRVFLDFSRFPLPRLVDGTSGRVLVRLVDVRFLGAPVSTDPDRARSGLAVTVAFDRAGHVVGEGFGN
jgi:membrane-bound metal-dependent hydrolase YbcI (DUF457 family)